MKRSPALVRLSREHHAALVLAKRAQRAADADAESARRFGATLAERFATELDPHFRIEEESLLPALNKAGGGELTPRTLAEHRELRALLADAGSGDGASLRRFGELLEAHVRFEERELFARAESVLDAALPGGLAPDPHHPANPTQGA